jgi:dUTP pyrophosphatase
MVKVQVRVLDPELPLPAKAFPGDAGHDLYARIGVTLSALTGAAKVATGIAVAIPTGYVGLICARSGLAATKGIGVLNAPGVIDSGYRGELSVVLFSVHDRATQIRRGDRIAQLVIVQVASPELEQVVELPPGDRDTAGFGGTGT